MKIDELENELKMIKSMKNKVLASLKHAPGGKIHCGMMKGKYPQYYLIGNDTSKKTGKGRYLRVNERNIAKRIAQRDYDEKMKHLLEKQERVIEDCLKVLKESSISNLYNGLPEARKMLVTPYYIPDEEFIQLWNNSSLKYQNTYPINNEYITERGEHVRSKSEKIIADKLNYLHIPYKYETAIKLNNKLFFPDFTCLNLKTRREIYIEHFGMMDKPDYCSKAIEKIEEYQMNGIVLGQDLLPVFESSQKGINVEYLEKILERVSG